MKIMTMSMVCGTKRCNAKCPFCVSRMTGTESMSKDESFLFGRNFKKARDLALRNGVTTVLITGKGEPTIYPLQISSCVAKLREFPFIELQTNGLVLEQWRYEDYPKILESWYLNGLTTISLSVVHYKQSKNRKIYGSEHYSLSRLSAYLQLFGFLVRINCTMVGGYIDSVNKVKEIIRWCQNMNIDQLTLRPVTSPAVSQDQDAYNWVNDNHKPDWETSNQVDEYIHLNGNQLMTLPHGAKVFDFDGLTMCLSDCLTLAPNTDEIRQLIVYPNGRVSYDWVYDEASTLLPMEKE